MRAIWAATAASAVLALAGSALSSSQASAAGFFNASRPKEACAPFAQDMSLPGLWLGHFTGGRLERAAVGRVVDWRDDYACFPTHAACDVWRSRLHREYRSVEGYQTCTPLRGGGVRIRRAAIAPHVVVAKY